MLAICGAWSALMCICGAWSAPMCWLYVVLRVHLCVGYMWCLERSYVLAISGASAPMCWLYVVLGAHLCVGYMWCLERTYVLAIYGAWNAPMCWLYVVRAHLCVGYMCCQVPGMHLVQERSGPCKIPNFSHLLWSYGTYMYFVRHVCIDP